jgi:tetratricopeptide (TPR) repeat protein
MRLVMQGRTRTLGDWLDFLGRERVDADPSLLARRAVLESESGRLDVSVRLYERAVAGALAVGDRATAFWTLRALSGACEQNGQYARATQALERALAIMPDADPAAGVRLKSQLAIMHLRRGDWQDALVLAEEALHEAAPVDEPGLEATMLNNYAFVLDAVGRLGEAEVVHLRALELKRRHGLDASTCFSLNNLGVNYQRQRRWQDAEAALDEAVRVAEEHGVVAIQSYALSNLGDVYRDQGRLERARDLYAQSLRLKESMRSPFALAHTWNSLATLWRQAGDLDQARQYNDRALALRSDDADPVERLHFRTEAARILLTRGVQLMPRASWSVSRTSCVASAPAISGCTPAGGLGLPATRPMARWRRFSPHCWRRCNSPKIDHC